MFWDIFSNCENYNILTGNKSEFYTGEFTGSYANINYHFESTNPNPYLFPSKSININELINDGLLNLK